ncbi:hypothetical protein Ddc_05668 [Ditylenchus destructor]|nr:hypothetical protein Ddc_05668 [Ditylenchus destructor]
MHKKQLQNTCLYLAASLSLRVHIIIVFEAEPVENNAVWRRPTIITTTTRRGLRVLTRSRAKKRSWCSPGMASSSSSIAVNRQRSQNAKEARNGCGRALTRQAHPTLTIHCPSAQHRPKITNVFLLRQRRKAAVVPLGWGTDGQASQPNWIAEWGWVVREGIVVCKGQQNKQTSNQAVADLLA